jgi:hypothetical protein
MPANSNSGKGLVAISTGEQTATSAQAERHELTKALARIIELTDPPTVAAAPRGGISLSSLRRLIRRGEVEQIMLGRDVRVWRDA